MPQIKPLVFAAFALAVSQALEQTPPIYAGAISNINVKPSNKLKGKVQVSTATAGVSSLFAALGFPILKDVLSARVKLRHFEYGGYADHERRLV